MNADHISHSAVPGEAGSPSLLRPLALLWGALAVGLVIETFLHGQPLATGYACAAVTAAAGWILLGCGQGLRPSRAAVVLLAVVVVLSLFVYLRASTTLRVMDVLAGLILMLIVPAVFVPGRLSRLSLSDYALELVVAGFAVLVQPILYLVTDLVQVRRAPAAPVAAPRPSLLPALRGLLFAVPVLLVFGALLSSADPVFASYVRQIFDLDIDLQDIFVRVMFALVLAWLALGLARYAFLRRPEGSLPFALSRPDGLRVGAVEAATVVGLLDLMFAAFVAIQAVYLFGGLDTLARTDLTYSEYARRGFFELVWVAALVAGLILSVDWLARPRTGAGARTVMSLHLVLVGLTLAILVSAVTRMMLYQREYGLTELRFYTSVFMGWLALMLVWLVVAVVIRPAEAVVAPGRRLFAAGALVSALVMILALNIANPDAVIARTNLAGADAQPDRFDSNYLTDDLSPDAVPTLVRGLPLIAGRCERAGLARNLQQEVGRLEKEVASRRWNGTNLGELRAVQAAREGAAIIAAAAAECP